MEGVGFGDDRLEGAAAIAEFTGETVRRVFHLAEKKLIPVGRIGGRLIASKKVLTEHYQKLVSGQAA
jgi:hypothetical protein